MLGRLRIPGNAHVLLGAIIASALNFYAYVIAPSLFAVGYLGQFVEDSYLSGFYMASAVSSIIPFCVFMYRSGGSIALRRYVQVSLIAAVLISIGGFSVARLPWSYLMIAGALLMHVAGFYLGALIHQERTILIAALQSFQPFLFACFITINQFVTDVSVPWSGLYLVSAALAVTVFAWTARHDQIKSDIAAVQQPNGSTFSVLARIVATVSFPMFFHVELFLLGNFGSVALGEYAILQKLYGSVATALFGSVGILILKRSLGNESADGSFLPKEIFSIATLAAITSPAVGFFIVKEGGSNTLHGSVLIICAINSFLYTLCTYASLRISITNPVKSLIIFLFSILFYTSMFFLINPNSIEDFIKLASVFFLFYIGGARLYFSFHRPFGGRALACPMDAEASRCD